MCRRAGGCVVVLRGEDVCAGVWVCLRACGNSCRGWDGCADSRTGVYVVVCAFGRAVCGEC